MPVASIIVPAFNVAATLRDTLNALLAQSFTDFEVIVVDDGSGDDTAAIAQSYCTDPRIRLIRQPNRGLAGARNTGIAAEAGRYVGFCDADDLWMPGKLAAHVAHLDAKPNVGLSYSGSALITEDGALTGAAQRPRLRNVSAAHVFKRNPVGNGSAAVLRRAALRDIAWRPRAETVRDWCFDETFRQSEDIECWLRLALRADWVIEGVPGLLTHYRIAGGGLSADTDRQLAAWERMVRKLVPLDPAMFARHTPAARAYQLRYLARRAVSRHDGAGALALTRRAFAASWRPLVEEPAKTLTTVAAAVSLGVFGPGLMRLAGVGRKARAPAPDRADMGVPHVVHLVDDATDGGVMRVLAHLTEGPVRGAHHSVQQVRRGAFRLRPAAGDVVVSHLSISWRALPSLIALRATHPGIPLVHVEHSYTKAFCALYVANPKRFQTLLRTAFALFDRIVAVSEAQGAWMRDRGLVEPCALRVIASSVDLAGFLALPDAPARPRVIAAIGRLNRMKGFDTLIEAFGRCPDPALRLHIYGEGEERAALKALAAGDMRVVFKGRAADPVAMMAAVDAVAMPSRCEAYGLVCLEARAAGRPVLVSAVDGLVDQAAEGAVPVAPGSPEAWAAALTRLAAAEGPNAPALLAARAAARAHGTRFADGWHALIAELTGDLAGDLTKDLTADLAGTQRAANPAPGGSLGAPALLG
ncbi:MAG: glycosyltransferase involved in cell wall biosynthesis [Paracoccaceae bacterium]|jgi:glycosyltransferase involved in cell wall biosynthesis